VAGSRPNRGVGAGLARALLISWQPGWRIAS